MKSLRKEGNSVTQIMTMLLLLDNVGPKNFIHVSTMCQKCNRKLSVTKKMSEKLSEMYCIIELK